MYRPDTGEIEALYLQSYGALTAKALEDQRLTASDADNIIAGLARHLDEFTGRLELDTFQTWALDVMQPAIFTHGIVNECRPYVRAAIKKGLGWPYRFGDLEDAVNELEARTWVKVLGDLPKWQKPGTAKLSSRHYAYAKSQARGWITEQLRAEVRLTPYEETFADGVAA